MLTRHMTATTTAVIVTHSQDEEGSPAGKIYEESDHSRATLDTDQPNRKAFYALACGWN
jgi:hypothetical protein